MKQRVCRGVAGAAPEASGPHDGAEPGGGSRLSSQILEYRDDVDPHLRWRQDDAGLHISAMSAHRIYGMWGWNNPITVKISHAEAADL